MKLVGSVVIQPWEREWEQEKPVLENLLKRANKKISKTASDRFNRFLERLRKSRVLDPACGSGNFLYLSLRALKNFEKKVIHEAEVMGFPPQFPSIGPESVLGIEINPYAAELARVSVWIGELQWQLENGFPYRRNPILKPLDQIECRDAVINDDGSEPQWPKATAIVGNPPFLGDKRLQSELGEEYVARLRKCYSDRLPGTSNLVAYWFEKARAQIVAGDSKRAGLVATNALRQPANRAVLVSIVRDTQIFTAWSDEPWVNEGAAVRVSLICFGREGLPERFSLDCREVQGIFADLTGAEIGAQSVDLTTAKPLVENDDCSFFGLCLAGEFAIGGDIARSWLRMPNPHGKPNSDVVRPIVRGREIMNRPEDRWCIDFGPYMSEEDAALYEIPFKHIEEHVKTVRVKNKRASRARNWWRHGEARPGLRRALLGHSRYIATSETSKHRVFVWLDTTVAPEHKLVVIPRSDDVTFGILSSRIHVVWALEMGSVLEDRPVYTASSCFATFPFPQGLTPNVPSESRPDTDASRRIAKAAHTLNELREAWLNPPEPVYCTHLWVIFPDTRDRCGDLSRRRLGFCQKAVELSAGRVERELLSL